MQEAGLIDALAGGQAGSLADFLKSGQTLGAALGHSLESQEALYALAYTAYSQAKYGEAMKMFAYLLTGNHLDKRFFSGFAACLHMQRRYGEALKYYAVASVLGLNDPEPVMRSAECWLALGDRAQARTALDYALTQARASEECRHYVPRLEAMLSFLDAPQASGEAPTTAKVTVLNNIRAGGQS